MHRSVDLSDRCRSLLDGFRFIEHAGRKHLRSAQHFADYRLDRIGGALKPSDDVAKPARKPIKIDQELPVPRRQLQVLAVGEHAEVPASDLRERLEYPLAGLEGVGILRCDLLRSLPRIYTCLARVLHVQWLVGIALLSY